MSITSQVYLAATRDHSALTPIYIIFPIAKLQYVTILKHTFIHKPERYLFLSFTYHISTSL